MSQFKSIPVKIGIRPTIDGRRLGVRESLEDQTMRMAKSVAELLQSHIRHTDGTFVECVIADTCIGGVAEAAACAEKFKLNNVGLTITVTPCWCYGSETIDMDPHMPKAIWGFNGTERPGAVYLAAALAGHSQLDLPAFSIYSTEVQEANDTSIPADVKEKLLRFARAGLAVATIRGKSYLSIGSVSMGIAGSIVNQQFFQEYLGMRNEYVDMTEIKRRLDRKIYDQEEVDLALSWVKQYCQDGIDVNSPENQRSPEERAELWENVVKMTIIARDLMVGNPKLAKLNFGEEALGHNAIAAGFQGQRHWTDHLPNGGFMDEVKKQQDIKLMEPLYSQSDMVTALNQTIDVLTSNPDLTAIFGANEPTAVGMARAIKERGFAGKLVAVGFDGNQDLQNFVRDGTLEGIVVQSSYQMGYKGVNTINKIIKGEKVDKFIDTGVVFVTKDNIDSEEAKAVLY